MTPLEAQMQVICARYAGATLQVFNGTGLVSVPGIQLPAGGWNRDSTSVTFVTPAGYPLAAPDCFWADRELRLRNGSVPQNCNVENQVPGLGQPRLWFSWHVKIWNPSRDTLLTYLGVIKARLEDVR